MKSNLLLKAAAAVTLAAAGVSLFSLNSVNTEAATVNSCDGSSYYADYYGETISLYEYAYYDPLVVTEDSYFQEFHKSFQFYNKGMINYRYNPIFKDYISFQEKYEGSEQHLLVLKNDPVTSFVDSRSLHEPGTWACYGEKYGYFVITEALGGLNYSLVKDGTLDTDGSNKVLNGWTNTVVVFDYTLNAEEGVVGNYFDFTPNLLYTASFVTLYSPTSKKIKVNNVYIENKGYTTFSVNTNFPSSYFPRGGKKLFLYDNYMTATSTINGEFSEESKAIGEVNASASETSDIEEIPSNFDYENFFKDLTTKGAEFVVETALSSNPVTSTLYNFYSVGKIIYDSAYDSMANVQIKIIKGKPDASVRFNDNRAFFLLETEIVNEEGTTKARNVVFKSDLQDIMNPEPNVHGLFSVQYGSKSNLEGEEFTFEYGCRLGYTLGNEVKSADDGEEINYLSGNSYKIQSSFSGLIEEVNRRNQEKQIAINSIRNYKAKTIQKITGTGVYNIYLQDYALEDLIFSYSFTTIDSGTYTFTAQEKQTDLYSIFVYDVNKKELIDLTKCKNLQMKCLLNKNTTYRIYYVAKSKYMKGKIVRLEITRINPTCS